LNSALFAQNDIQTLNALAKQAKDRGEIEKAVGYYEDLYGRTFSTYHFTELLDAYYILENYKEAEKLIKKRIKKYPDSPEFLIDYGLFYKQTGDQKEAENYFKEAVNEFDGNPQEGRNLAQKFNLNKLFSYSEEIYLKSQKANRNEELFQLDLAANYLQQGKTEEMIDEYLLIIGRNPSYLQYVQSIFARVLNPDPDGEMKELLKRKTIKIVQDNPNSYTHVELLIWLYLQEENYTGALIQAKAIDKKLNENGKRVFSLAQLAKKNKNFEVAKESYQYILGLGDDSPYFLKSKMELVGVERDEIFRDNNYTKEDLLSLQNSYYKLIEDLGKSAYTINVIRDLANLKAYYLDSIESAIKILYEALDINSLSLTEKAEIKLELGDLLLIDGDKWEASLLYSQVEKDFKYDQLGETAKFKNAKIAFYIGDFFWAQAQLDVLKGSTSKLISNDAMDLSLLITDNIGLDSIAEPLEMYARAELLQLKKSYVECIKTLDSIPKFFPASSLKDEILMKKYQIAFDQKEYKTAANYLEELIANYAEDILGDDALFYLASLNEEYLDQKDVAQEQYKQLITVYPGSLFVVESRKRFRNLRGDNPL
jgi:tetratricopeptide (TPR) repeat protein